MAITLGEILRLTVRDHRLSAKDICEEVGMSRGNLDKLYKKDSINTDLLARLCTTLEHDFFQYVNPFIMAEYEGPRHHSAHDDPRESRSPMNQLHNCKAELTESKKELDFLEREIGWVKSSISDKDRLIEMQDDKLKELQSALMACRESRGNE